MPVRDLLDLLLREAPPADFDALVAAARADGTPVEELAELESAVQAALQVRTTLRQRRRREAELSALFDTSRDLAAVRDVDAVLQAIVRRARSLLRAEVAYLSLVDPERGDTYVRITDGSVSEAFQRVRLPPGAGLGGAVAERAAPYTTSDYFHDERFRHTRGIDDAVREEGLVAILGVPLVRRTEVIGVLFAGDRAQRPFAAEEVALLSSFADSAAVALENARMFEETQLATAAARSSSEVLERASEAHDRLTDLVLRGGGVEDVANAVGELLGGDIAVHDEQGAALASTGSPVPFGPDVARAVAASRAGGRAVRCDDPGRRHPRWVAAVAAGPETLGSLLLSREAGLGPAEQRIFERAAVVTAVLLLFRRSLAEAEQRMRGELLADLLADPPTDPAGVRERARRLGASLERPHAVAVAGAGAALRRRLEFAAGATATSRGGLAGTVEGAVVVLLPGAEPAVAAKDLAAELGRAIGQPVTAGAAGPAHGLAALAAAHREARRCHDTLEVLGRRGHGASAEDLGFVGLLLSRERDVAAFVARTVGPVLDYDAERGTELVRTLRAYFAAGGSLSRTRGALHVHVNTVAQRLERVGSLLGDDWQRPERALEVQLALHLHQLHMG